MRLVFAISIVSLAATIMLGVSLLLHLVNHARAGIAVTERPATVTALQRAPSATTAPARWVPAGDDRASLKAWCRSDPVIARLFDSFCRPRMVPRTVPR